MTSGEFRRGGQHTWATFEFWPVFVNVIRDGYDIMEMETVLDANEEALRRGRPFATIRDIRGVTQNANALQRKRLAQWQEENKELIRDNCLGVVSIVESALVRGMIRAVFWVSTPVIREEIVGTVDAASAQIFEWLDEKNVMRPPGCTRERLAAALHMQRL